MRLMPCASVKQLGMEPYHMMCSNMCAPAAPVCAASSADGILPCLLQILGSIFGSLVYAGLIPGLRIGATHFSGEIAPGCFGPAEGVHNAELFWWEVRRGWAPGVEQQANAH